ncbi:hypothetical protein Nepgr_002604 [Nepenthes gracilis]|uniref:Uncharacterized protein n=1 Tax=Nepenthes gracilis TaxID=150966 RepID=A0AAD3P418_NEPGR|nr:hypothetical protein Nepgr_002604 [Nepenthes gracilis]
MTPCFVATTSQTEACWHAEVQLYEKQPYTMDFQSIHALIGDHVPCAVPFNTKISLKVVPTPMLRLGSMSSLTPRVRSPLSIVQMFVTQHPILSLNSLVSTLMIIM